MKTLKTLLMSFLSLTLLMASLLIQSPVMALSIPLTQHQPFLGAKSVKAPASTQNTDRKLQSSIGPVTSDGDQAEKKGNAKDRANDGKKVDQMTKGLMTKKS